MENRENVEWLLELAGREEPPAVALAALQQRGLCSGSDLELGLLQQAGCSFQQETRTGELWCNSDDFVAASVAVAATLGPPESAGPSTRH